MSIKLGVVMDPIETIRPNKDTTFAMLLAAQNEGWQIHYVEQHDLFLKNGSVQAHMHQLKVTDDNEHWFEILDSKTRDASFCDVILMRKDPPFNMEYIYTTYLLELIEKNGTLIINKPQSLRDANEKLFTAWFPEICPRTIVTSKMNLLKDFLVKPLDGMGGQSIFRIKVGDPNTNVIFEEMTARNKKNIMAQQYISEVVAGDKRVIMIDGNPIPYALARLPASNETRANLAAGGKGIVQTLSSRDLHICEIVGETLREKGLLFVGLDIIGDYLSEINVTSPTCIREIDAGANVNIGEHFINCIKRYL